MKKEEKKNFCVTNFSKFYIHYSFFRYINNFLFNNNNIQEGCNNIYILFFFYNLQIFLHKNFNLFLDDTQLKLIHLDVILYILTLGTLRVKIIKQLILKKTSIDRCVNLLDIFILFKIINNFMYNGKKDVICKIINAAFVQLRFKYKREPLFLFRIIIKKISPVVFLKKKRVAGRIYKMPVFLNRRRQILFGIKLFVSSVRLRSEKSLDLRICHELHAILMNESVSLSLKKRIEINKECILNKFYIKFL